MMMPLDRPARMSRTDLLVAIIALLFLLAARPILAQTSNESDKPTNSSDLSSLKVR